MAQRYKQITKQGEELYSQDCPVTLEAYAILEDQKERKTLAQLKFKNCSAESITGIIITIQAFDQIGNSIEELSKIQYTNVDASPGETFGSKKPIYFSGDIAVQTLKIFANNVIFENGIIWHAGDSNLFQAKKPTISLDSMIPEAHLLQEYRTITSREAEFIPVMIEDSLWQCACGTINANRSNCLKCQAEKIDVFEYLNRDKLANSYNERQYSKALALLQQDNVQSLKEAVDIFRNLGSYKDSDSLLEESKSKAIKLEEEENRQRAIAEEEERQRKILEATKRKKKIIVFSALTAVALLAVILVVKVVIPQSEYNSAITLMNQSEYREAIKVFESLNGYKDSVEKIQECNVKIEERIMEEKIAAFMNTPIGGIIRFGTYEQDNNLTNGKEEVSWRVIDKKNDEILVISEYALDFKKYEESGNAVTWSSSSLRKWLNNDLLNEIFTDAERKYIPLRTIKADIDCQDQIFLLNTEEANKYFTSNDDRMCEPTDFSIKNVQKSDLIQEEYYYEKSFITGKVYYGSTVYSTIWMLRSVQNDRMPITAMVGPDGSLWDNNIQTGKDGKKSIYGIDAGFIRPAVWITNKNN